jgi:hypothetical protein
VPDDNPYPDGAAVYVRYPLPGQDRQPRGTWAMLPGTVEQRCGGDEWLVYVEHDDVAEYDEDGEPWYPGCFRDRSELARRPS